MDTRIEEALKRKYDAASSKKKIVLEASVAPSKIKIRKTRV